MELCLKLYEIWSFFGISRICVVLFQDNNSHDLQLYNVDHTDGWQYDI